MLTVQQSAERAGVSPSFIYQLCGTGKLPYILTGEAGRIAIHPEALAACFGWSGPTGPDEDAFVAKIAEDPDDDTCRLVYADWLDERGDPRGEYLRLQVEWARMDCGPKARRRVAVERRLRQLRTRIDPGWIDAAGKRYDVVLCSYEFQEKIRVIAQVRRVTGCGLTEARDRVEGLRPIATRLPLSAAERLRRRLLERAPGFGWCLQGLARFELRPSGVKSC